MITIKDKKECCGCWACADVCTHKAITMMEDFEGFRYPVIDEDKCVDCGLCDKVCPIINVEAEKPKAQRGYLLQHRDLSVLRDSTSGGAFTALGQWVIGQGGVVFGAAFVDGWQVRHVMVDTVEGLARFRNSKYVQSQIGDSFNECKKILSGGGKLVLFSGTPCQIEGLRRYLRKDYDNLLTVDVVCRAVPSPKLLRKYIEYHVGTTQSPLERVRFRDKYYGYQYSSFTFGHSDITEDYHRGVESDPYLRAFFSNTSVRPSCYDCRFKKRYRISDITIWDCFSPDTYGVKVLAHDFSLGVTKVLVHSERGAEAVEAIRPYAAIEEIVPETVIRGAREMTECVPKNARRAAFFRDLDNLQFDDVVHKYYPLTLRKRVERIIRVTLFKWGIYYRAKQIFKKFYKNKNNQKS